MMSCPKGSDSEWTGTTFQEQKTGNVAIYIFSLSIVCVFLFMAALYESWIRPMVIVLTVPLAMFGAIDRALVALRASRSTSSARSGWSC